MRSTGRHIHLCLSLTFLMASWMSAAHGQTGAALRQDQGGWKMLVNDKPFFVKGFTWSRCPVGKKYDYDLFAEETAAIEAAIERDMSLIRDAGGNTIRGVVPSRWMKHIHENYGMHFIANDYCGRYGLTIDGTFVPQINYADPRTRDIIKATWRKIATEYRDVPGLIAHALGNENNYGLEWQSAEVENLPVGEQHRAKARHLYSLFNELAIEIKKIDPEHPVGIVNGDLQYLDLIAELCPDIDYLGVNAYRGENFSDLFAKVAETLGKPVILMETGCDAYNAHEQREDQLSQAEVIHSNWIDLYRHTARNGGSGNCLGGMVFQWADEWWKKGQQTNLSVHDTEASWHHQWYKSDAEAEKNMNEEWFGVCSIREEAINGAHLIQPRMAYFALQDLWQHDPYYLGEPALQELKLNVPQITLKAQAAATAVKQRLPTAAIPKKSTANQLDLPVIVYAEAEGVQPWAPSGVMPAQNAISLNPNCTTQPHSGLTCLQVSYNAERGWSGVMWQHPENDWENDLPGGYDLSGAKELTFWARGEKGGEKVTIKMGGPPTGKFPNSTSGELAEITLGKEWKAYHLPLDEKDMRRIKNPFTVIVSGCGAPFQLYLDDVVYQ